MCGLRTCALPGSLMLVELANKGDPKNGPFFGAQYARHFLNSRQSGVGQIANDIILWISWTWVMLVMNQSWEVPHYRVECTPKWKWLKLAYADHLMFNKRWANKCWASTRERAKRETLSKCKQSIFRPSTWLDISYYDRLHGDWVIDSSTMSQCPLHNCSPGNLFLPLLSLSLLFHYNCWCLRSALHSLAGKRVLYSLVFPPWLAFIAILEVCI